MKCPNCGVENFGTTRTCASGHNFSSKQVREARKRKGRQYELSVLKETLNRCIRELQLSPDSLLWSSFARVATMLEQTGIGKVQGLAARCAHAGRPYALSRDEQLQAKEEFIAAARVFLAQLDQVRS